jgi:hypothetical protein
MKNQSKYNFISLSYFLYLLGYFSILIGLNFISETYVYYLKNIIEFIIAILLIYKFSFKDGNKFNYFDKTIIVISGWLLLSNTLFITILKLKGMEFISKIQKNVV